jgi:hypothetical protein
LLQQLSNKRDELKRAWVSALAVAKRKRTLGKKTASKAGPALEPAGQAAVFQQGEVEPQSIAARIPGASPQLVGVLQGIAQELQLLKRVLVDPDASAASQPRKQRTEGPDALMLSTRVDFAADAIADVQDAGADVSKTTAKTYVDALYSYARAMNDRDLMERAHPDVLVKLALKDYVARALTLYREWGDPGL